MAALQGQAGTLSGCGVCHGGLVPGMGPHGLVPHISEFENSLHATREGFRQWYAAENNGFETITGIPYDSLNCQSCHPGTRPDGTVVNPDAYQPACNDCHDFSTGTHVAQETCLVCHKRQKKEIALAEDPMYTDHFSDVHREAGMICTDCHGSMEIHGTDIRFSSLHEEGALSASCENNNCHPAQQLAAGNVSHDIHLQQLDCQACHVKTVMSCNSCHFETKAESDNDRYYGTAPQHDFVMLVNSQKTGKVTTASYQSLVYRDAGFFAIAPFYGHTITVGMMLIKYWFSQ
jgi:hypothetical protein